MLQIYKPNECPAWIEDKCKKETLTSDNTKYTYYSGHGKDVIYYIIYKDKPLSAVIHALMELEDQDRKLTEVKKVSEISIKAYNKYMLRLQIIFWSAIVFVVMFIIAIPMIKYIFSKFA